MGVRKLRNPLQGVRPGGCPPQSLGEAGRRREGPRVHRRGADRGPAHPLGQGRGLRGTVEARAGARRETGRHQLQHLPGRRLQAGQHLPPGRGDPPQGRRPPVGVRRHHGRDRVARSEAVVRRRDQLSRPGRHPRAPGPAGRGARRGLRAPRRRPADAAGVQVLRARVLHDRCAGLGHRLRPLPQARPEGAGRGRHGPPRAGDQHRVHRGHAAARGEARGVRLQLAVLRRRRPDGRGRRPVPAVPDHVRGRARGRVHSRGRVHARPVPQHRGEDPRDHPLGDERAGGHGEGAAGGPGGPCCCSAGGGCAGGECGRDGRVQHGCTAVAA